MLIIDHNDSKYWNDIVGEHLDQAIALAKEIETKVQALDDSVLSLDLFKLVLELQGIKARNSHVAVDLIQVSASIEKLPTFYRTI